MGQWLKEGVTDMRPTLSRKENMSQGCKYVQEYAMFIYCLSY